MADDTDDARIDDTQSQAQLAPSLGEAGKAEVGKAMARLNRKEQTFVREYLVCMDVAEASRRTGCSRVTGHRILNRSLVREAIREEHDARQRRLALDADRVVEELALVAFSDIADYMDIVGGKVLLNDLTEIPPRLRRAIAEVQEQETARGHQLKFKLHDKMRALELICKHLGLTPDVLTLRTQPGEPLQVQPLPPKPQTIEEWERQVEEAAKRRLASQTQLEQPRSDNSGDDDA